MAASFLIYQGPPPFLLQKAGEDETLHDQLRALDKAMDGVAAMVQIDNYPTSETPPATPVNISIVWKRGTVSSGVQGIIVATTKDEDAKTPAKASATSSAGESSAYAGGGDYTSNGAFNGGESIATTTGLKSRSHAVGGRTRDAATDISSTGTGGLATASSTMNESQATAYGGTLSGTGGAATATARGTSLGLAYAYGGRSTGSHKDSDGHTIGNKGGNATASGKSYGQASGGQGADVLKGAKGDVSGDGGDAKATGGNPPLATGGQPGKATGDAIQGKVGNHNP